MRAGTAPTLAELKCGGVASVLRGHRHPSADDDDCGHGHGDDDDDDGITGEQPPSSMTPAVLELRSGGLLLIGGSGGSMITSAVALVTNLQLASLVSFGFSLLT